MNRIIRAIRARIARPQQPDEHGLTPEDYDTYADSAAAAEPQRTLTDVDRRAIAAIVSTGDPTADTPVFDDLCNMVAGNFRRSTTTPDGWAA